MSDRSYEITAEALAALEAELAELEGAGRREMAERIKTARAWGDLKENAEYHDAKNSQAHLETKILRLQDRRRHAIVVEAGSTDGTVALGSTVVVDDGGRETTYVLVGATEADARRRQAEHRVAAGAVAARRASAGDVVDFEAPQGRARSCASSACRDHSRISSAVRSGYVELGAVADAVEHDPVGVRGLASWKRARGARPGEDLVLGAPDDADRHLDRPELLVAARSTRRPRSSGRTIGQSAAPRIWWATRSAGTCSVAARHMMASARARPSGVLAICPRAARRP